MSNSGVGTAASGANGASLNPQNLGQNAREGARPYRGGQVAGTEKMKKNGRKLNSGIPAKILIGRSGQNVVIQGNHYLNGPPNGLNEGAQDVNRRTMMNYHTGIGASGKKYAQDRTQIRKSQDTLSGAGQGMQKSQGQLGIQMAHSSLPNARGVNGGLGSRNQNPLQYINNQ